MKKKKVLIIGLCVAAVVILAGVITWIAIATSNLKPNAPDLSREEIYDPKLEEFYEVIADPDSADVLYDGLSIVQQAALEFGDGALDELGYMFQDVNNDGRDELFIGCFDTGDTSSVKNDLYAGFTYDGEVLTPLFEKQKRNTFALTDTGTFYFHGSDGVAYHIVGEYELTEEEGIVCKNFYFSYPKFGDINELEYFHNTTGEWDPEASEKVDMTFEQLEEIRKELAARTVALDAESFSEIGKK